MCVLSTDLNQQIFILLQLLWLTLLAWHQRGALVVVCALTLFDVAEFFVELCEHLALCILLSALSHNVLEHEAIAADHGLVL